MCPLLGVSPKSIWRPSRLEARPLELGGELDLERLVWSLDQLEKDIELSGMLKISEELNINLKVVQ